MAWSGSGTYSRTNGTNSGANTWADDAAAATPILAARHDTHDEDIATAITACLTKNMETKPTAHFAPNVTATYDIGTTSLKWRSEYLSGDLVFLERADHAATPAATYGQLWVRNDAPNALIFTDDAGTDHPITGQFVVKASDESVTSSTTLQDDDDLKVTLAATSTYFIQIWARFTSASSTPDVKFQLTEADGSWVGIFTSVYSGGTRGTAGVDSALTNGASNAIVTPYDTILVFDVHATTGGAGGVFKLEWAQDTSDATAVICKAGSWMRATKIG